MTEGTARLLNRPWPAAFVLVLAVQATFVWSSRAYNWDLLPYVACVLTFHGHSEEEAATMTYAQIKAVAPPGLYGELIADPPPTWLPPAHTTYRQDMFRNPDHFRQQLPFYRTKLGYVGVVSALATVVSTPVSAAHCVSWAGFVGFGLLIFSWVARRTTERLGFVVAGCLIVTPSLSALGSLVVPDMLALALLVAAAWAITALTPRRFAISAACIAAVAVRPDNVMMLLPLLALVAWRGGRLHRSFFIALSAGLALECVTLVRYAHDYGYHTLFWNTLVEPLVTPAETSVRVTPALYFKALRAGWPRLVEGMTLSGTVVALVALAGAKNRSDRRWEFVAASLGVLPIRFLLLPGGDLRYLLGPAILAMVFGIDLLLGRTTPETAAAGLTPA